MCDGPLWLVEVPAAPKSNRVGGLKVELFLLLTEGTLGVVLYELDACLRSQCGFRFGSNALTNVPKHVLVRRH